MSFGESGMGEYPSDWFLECIDVSPSSSTGGISTVVVTGNGTSSMSAGPRKITSSCSPGSLLYAGKDVVDIWDGVLRGRLARLVRVADGGLDVAPSAVPASCSAVSSRTPPLAVGRAVVDEPVPEPELRPGIPLRRLLTDFRNQQRQPPTTSSTTTTTIGTQISIEFPVLLSSPSLLLAIACPLPSLSGRPLTTENRQHITMKDIILDDTEIIE